MFKPSECAWCGDAITHDEKDEAVYVIEGPPHRDSVPLVAFHGEEQVCYREARDYGWN